MNMLKYIKFFIIFFILFSISCTTIPREYSGNIESSNILNVVKNTLKVSIVSQPTIYNPRIIISLKADFRIQHNISENSALVERNTNLAFPFLGSGLLLLLLGFFNFPSSTKTLLTIAGISGILLGLFQPPTQDAKIVSDERTISKNYETVDEAKLIDRDISISYLNNSKIYHSDNEGNINIHLVKDLNIDNLEAGNEIELKIQFDDNNDTFSTNLLLSPKLFLSEVFIVTFNKGWIYASDSANSEILAFYEKNNVYFIKNNNLQNYWIQIYNTNITGWVPKNTGKIILKNI